MNATAAIRRATPNDATAVLALFDAAIAWFTEIGNTEQWGSEPWSTQERQVARIAEACDSPDSWVHITERGEVNGFLVLGDAMPYVPAPEQPELYVRVLIASRAPHARGVGRRLMAFADDRALADGVTELRVDCYRGGSGALVRYYESCGYERTSVFDDGGWPGQVLARSLAR
ncbi:GNAT family N-acetyltransferase [Leucobacter albus]|uniref:GNAT family N-acetyltransferase n=1 Tax=Leucobacter albus TaxID=272210 RepID=A0ABW3TLH1_9MICO